METMIQAPICPSCTREMSYQEHIKSWKCNACNPAGENVPICKTQVCKRPLTFLGEPWNCWICLHCNEHPAKVNQRTAEQQEETKRPLVDVKPDEHQVSGMIKEALAGIGDTVRDIVQDELANWHIQRPPITQDEIVELPESKALEIKPETWRQKAKRMGVKLHRPDGAGIRKKVDVLAEMEALEQKQGETDGGSSDIET